MMKRTRWLVAGLALAIILSMTWIAVAQDDIAKHPACKYCGMDRKTFAHSRMLVTYEDGSQVGTCSIHCTAVELALAIDKTPTALQVGEFKTKGLIDAETAAWVVGGTRQGVMTKRAKWAFGSRPDAEAFVKESGGSQATFDQAMKASYEDMYADTKMIREKRKMMKQKMQQQHKH